MTIKKVGVIAILAVAAFGLSGCFKSTAHYTLHQDDTVSGEMIAAMDKQFAEGMSPDEAGEQIGGPEGVEGLDSLKSQPYDDGKFIGVKYTFEREPLEAIASTVDGTLVREGDTFVYQGNPVDTSEIEGMESYLEGAIATLSITFPGSITDTNGSVKGTTVTWDLLTLTEAPYATGSAIGSGDSGDDSGLSTGALIAIVCGVLVAIVVAVVMSKRSKDEEAPSAPEAAEKPVKNPSEKKDKKD